MKRHLGVDHLKEAQQTLRVDFILAGYDNQDISEPRIETYWVFSGTPTIEGKRRQAGHILRFSNKAQKTNYVGTWIGRAEFIGHFFEKNKRIPPLRGQLDLLSLSDAAAYANFLVEFVCDYQRFAPMVPDCGRPITSARLTPYGYTQQTI
jgi:hypothetical protein